MAKTFGIDIGGSGVKGAPVDVGAGTLEGDRYRIPTPQPSTPDAVLDVAAEIIKHFGWTGRVGCAIPSVVQNGIALTAANIDESWIGTDGRAMLEERVKCDVWLLNDADAAGLAEMRFGAGRDESGLVLVLTFGTGIGSAMFSRGHLIPNSEFGHLEFRGMEAEHYAAARLVEADDMRIDWWASRVNEFLQHIEFILNPDVIIFGGGISKRFDDFENFLDTRAKLRVAELRNEAGIVGAALAAYENLD